MDMTSMTALLSSLAEADEQAAREQVRAACARMRIACRILDSKGAHVGADTARHVSALADALVDTARRCAEEGGDAPDGAAEEAKSAEQPVERDGAGVAQGADEDSVGEAPVAGAIDDAADDDVDDEDISIQIPRDRSVLPRERAAYRARVEQKMADDKAHQDELERQHAEELADTAVADAIRDREPALVPAQAALDVRAERTRAGGIEPETEHAEEDGHIDDMIRDLRGETPVMQSMRV